MHQTDNRQLKTGQHHNIFCGPRPDLQTPLSPTKVPEVRLPFVGEIGRAHV